MWAQRNTGLAQVGANEARTGGGLNRGGPSRMDIVQFRCSKLSD